MDTSFANKYKNKLFIQTLGKKGLKYSLNGSEWNILGAFENDNIVDTSGAGDWTTATFLNYLKVHNALNIAAISESLVKEGLSEAQKVGALSCSFEGARGMMTIKE
ncbi:pfkB family kinase [human gut metagenome]|uniref:PfkB family kinase n=1 Tax=human gut metagenome TaxID=408170 RepID=K1RYS8_9ZZZZ